jgi:hypothetical protein
LDFSNPTVLTNILYEEVECEKDRVIYDYGVSAKKKNASLRIRNALSAMSMIGRFMQKFKYGFLGDHVNEQYANKFLKVKLETEIKSFYTKMNSPTKYVLQSLTFRYSVKRFEVKSGLISRIKFTHESTLFPAYLSYLTTTMLDSNKLAMTKESTVAGRDLSIHLKDSSYSKKNLYISGITRKIPGGDQLVLFGKEVKKNLIVFNSNAICPRSRYLIQAGEMWFRHGKLWLNLKFQQRIQYGIYLLY